MSYSRLCRWPALAVALHAGAAVPSSAEPRPLSGEAIRETISGATVHLDTPLGTVLPLVFSEDGTVTGTAGRLAFYLGSASDRGRWWVSGGRLCYRFSRWFDGEQSCIKIRRHGARFEWHRDDGKSGTATIAHRPPPRLAPPQAPAQPSTAPVVAAAPPAIAPAPAAATTPTPAPAIADLPRTPAAPAAKSATPSTATEPSVVVLSAPAPVPAVRPPRPAPAPSAVANAERTAAPRPIAAPGPVPAPVALVHPRFPGRLASYRVVGVDFGDVLNVRAQPFAEAAVVAAIPANARSVRRLGPCQGWWCLVGYNAHSGWVNVMYLEPEASGARGPSP